MKPGDVLSPITFPITREMLVDYANASGDQNPIHQDEPFAKSVGLPDVIAHGMLTMGLAATALEEWMGAATIVEFGTRFTKPVLVPVSGATVTFSGTVLNEIEPNKYSIEITAVSNEVKVLGMCRAVVQL